MKTKIDVVELLRETLSKHIEKAMSEDYTLRTVISKLANSEITRLIAEKGMDKEIGKVVRRHCIGWMTRVLNTARNTQ